MSLFICWFFFDFGPVLFGWFVLLELYLLMEGPALTSSWCGDPLVRKLGKVTMSCVDHGFRASLLLWSHAHGPNSADARVATKSMAVSKQ